MLNNTAKTINRHKWIAEAAYFRAEKRGFEPGKELDDWLVAETDFADRLIAAYVAVFAEDGPITVVSLQQLASLIGIENSDHLTTEIELIRAIQNVCKHRPCFRSESDKLCDEMDCQWRTECRKLISVWCQ